MPEQPLHLVLCKQQKEQLVPLRDLKSELRNTEPVFVFYFLSVSRLHESAVIHSNCFPPTPFSGGSWEPNSSGVIGTAGP